MSVQTAKIINVIEVKAGDTVQYFTLDGFQIGGFSEGVRVGSSAPQPEPVRPAGKVVKPISPQQAKAESEAETERTFDDILKRKPAKK